MPDLPSNSPDRSDAASVSAAIVAEPLALSRHNSLSSDDEEDEIVITTSNNSVSDSDSDSDSESEYGEEDDESIGADSGIDNDSADDEEEDELLTTAILNEIKQGIYVCLVCTEEIDDESEVWSCHFCSRVYDLDCIRGWAKKDSSLDKENKWRCPSCNNKSTEIPAVYTCWCGKVIGPPKNIFAPHSCGQTCSEPLPTCPHTCPLSCHPGPHSKTCQALPVLKCDCGAQSRQFPCIIAPYKDNWKCDTVCNQLMPCGIHRHQQKCHAGLCGPCEELVEATCYCGKHTDMIPCYLNIPIGCTNRERSSWVGAFQCDSTKCGAVLDCNNESHVCELPFCHPQSTDAHSKFYHRCALNPQILKNCPCGKTSISDLLGGKNRELCSDPIPTCEHICGKVLDCGHKCYWKCHTGNEHARCYQVIDSNCDCGFSKFSVPCGFVQSGNTPKCTRKCQALKNCRRHRCGNICCPYEKVSIKRDRDRKKNNFTRSDDSNNETNANPNRDSDIEAVHICLEPCNKLLSCKNHRCQWQDHPGKCPPCLESSSDDLLCACGRTVLIEAPVRCGSVPTTKCQFQCTRPSACGHQMPHLCHQDNVECPKCTKLVNKECACGKRIIKGVYCYQERASCGTKCDKKLVCGHECPRICCPKTDDHSTVKCTSKCNKIRPSCGHPDGVKCHWPRPCNENAPCKAVVKLYCPCKRRTKTVECQATTTSTSKAKEPLECDAECMRIKRNQQLFAALNLGDLNSSTSSLASDLGSNKQTLNPTDIMVNPYSDYIIGVYTKQKKWCQQVENIFRDLVGKWLDDKTTAKKRYNFPPMRKPQRTFIHHLSDIYGLFSQSQDPEPRRSVYVSITPTSNIPPVMLSEALLSNQTLLDRIAYEQELRDIGAADFNAIILTGCRFGITVNEIEELFTSVFQKSWLFEKTVGNSKGQQGANAAGPVIKWVSEGKFLILPNDYETLTKRMEVELSLISSKFKTLVQQKQVAADARLCKVDFNGETILKYSESTTSSSNGNGSTTTINDKFANDVQKDVANGTFDLSEKEAKSVAVDYNDKAITDWF